MCIRPISCECEHISAVAALEELNGLSESDSDFLDNVSDETSCASDSSGTEDWWDEPEPTSGHRVRGTYSASFSRVVSGGNNPELVPSSNLLATGVTEPSYGPEERQSEPFRFSGYDSEETCSSCSNEEVERKKMKLDEEDSEMVAAFWHSRMRQGSIDTTKTDTEYIGVKQTEIIANFRQWKIYFSPYKKTDSFKNILRDLKVKNKYISRGNDEILDECVPGLDEFYNCNRALEKFGTPTQTLVKFALFLDLNCPSAYEFVINNYNTPLPRRKDLSEWYLDELGRPGLARESFEILKEIASYRRITCTLKWYLVKVVNSKVDHKHDKVFVRDACPRTGDQPVQTFVFELTSIDEGWRIPVGFFYADSVPEETHASFIRACLTQCYEAGVDVVAVTFNTASPAEHLGCRFNDLRNLKTTFKHPACDRDVAAWIDPHASFKSVYHTLKSRHILYTATEERVRWNLIKKLKKLSSSHNVFSCEEDLLSRHFDTILDFHHHIAKVGLTSAFMSGSLASALAVGQVIMPNWFKNTGSTEYFINTFNKLYDILNYPGQVYTDEVADDILNILDTSKSYIIGIFRNAENDLKKEDSDNLNEKFNIPFFMEGTVISGFIGFLVTIESYKYFIDTFFTKEKSLNCLSTSRLCRNQYKYISLESWESMADHFQSRYRELSHDNLLGYELSLILEVSLQIGSVNPFAVIKATSDKRAFDYDQPEECRPHKPALTARELRATQTMERYVRWLDREMLVVKRKYMVGYLAGWIAATYAKSLKCEECVDLLLSDKKLWFHKYIPRKEMEWICLPSEGLFRVCWECERPINGKRTAQRVREDVFTNLSVRSPWSARPERHHWTHATLLIHLIVDKYIAIRVSPPFPTRNF